MDRRLLDVTAYTTFDFVPAQATGPDWLEEAIAVLDASVPDHDPECVELSLELDPSDLDNLDHHADIVKLSPNEARELASDLETAANKAEQVQEVD
jgi:hypothetical protein